MAVEQTDAQLVSRCRAGDPEAWNEFVERFSRYVYAICSRGFRLAQPDAEDVFQEVFARAFERLSELRSDDAVRPWLAQLTRRLCIDRPRPRAGCALHRSCRLRGRRSMSSSHVRNRTPPSGSSSRPTSSERLPPPV